MDLDINKRIYELTSQIPKGRISTYGILANVAGKPKASRSIGRILSNNPRLVLIPCHRIVYSNGRIGGYTGGVKLKIKLLASEGIIVKNGKILDFRKKIFSDFKYKHANKIKVLN
jgi:O-6-methylguanine DNA methyltransferase